MWGKKAEGTHNACIWAKLCLGRTGARHTYCRMCEGSAAMDTAAFHHLWRVCPRQEACPYGAPMQLDPVPFTSPSLVLEDEIL